jgi:FdhD protein
MEPMENTSAAKVRITKVTGSKSTETDDLLAVEEPLEIQLQYVSGGRPVQKCISVTMRTPGHDSELALGFLFTEGIITSENQVKGVDVLHDNAILVRLKDDETPNLQSSDRNFYTTSSCGVCGKAGIDAIRTISRFQHLANPGTFETDSFFGLSEKLGKAQDVFNNTGGLHASALFDPQFNLLCLREDVGRHNALDKLIGACLMNQLLPLSNAILLLSGRASFELIQKASMAGIIVVAAIGAPSSLAVQLANEFDMTLIGFLRDHRFNIYSGAKRVKGELPLSVSGSIN